MPKHNTARKTVADEAVTVEHWTGAPVQCAQWMVQLALGSLFMLCCEMSVVLVNIENRRYSRGDPSKTLVFYGRRWLCEREGSDL